MCLFVYMVPSYQCLSIQWNHVCKAGARKSSGNADVVQTLRSCGRDVASGAGPSPGGTEPYITLEITYTCKHANVYN